MATEVEIILVREMPAMDPARVGGKDTVVAFKVSGLAGPPDHIVIPKANPTEAEIAAAIKTRLSYTGMMQGRKLTL